MVFLLKILKSAWWKMLIFAVLIGLLVGACTELFIPKKYSSSIDFYIVNMSITSEYTTNSLLAATEYLANDYIEIIKGDAMMEKINEKLTEWGKETYTHDDLRSMISSKTGADTSIFSISVEAESANLAYAISKVICEYAPDIIKDITRPSYVANLYVYQGVGADGIKTADDYALISETDLECVGVVRAPVKPEEPVSPNPVQNSIVSGILMAMLVYILCFTVKVSDTVIHSEENLKSLIDKPVIGNVPHWHINSKAKKN